MKLDNKKITLQQHWPTNVIIEDVDISDKDNVELIKIGVEYSKGFKHVPDKLDPERKGYNLLNLDHPLIHKFSAFIKSRVQMIMEVLKK